MRKAARIAFIYWVVAYADNPNANPSTTHGQALAIKIHALMSDSEWRTAKAIAESFGEYTPLVRDVMSCIKDGWGYESSKSRNKGYRRNG